jgi:hypothetical protein
VLTLLLPMTDGAWEAMRMRSAREVAPEFVLHIARRAFGPCSFINGCAERPRTMLLGRVESAAGRVIGRL